MSFLNFGCSIFMVLGRENKGGNKDFRERRVYLVIKKDSLFFYGFLVVFVCNFNPYYLILSSIDK